MPLLIDTNVAIHWRDGTGGIGTRLRELSEPPALSLFTRVELINGLYGDPATAKARTVRLDAILAQTQTLPFTLATLDKYQHIVAASGHSRRTILDRLIAATALEYDFLFATTNADDFQDVPGLKLEDWGLEET